MTNVYNINGLIVSADNPPQAAEYAKELGFAGYPKLIPRPTTWEKVNAATNSARAIAKMMDN